MWVWGSDSHMDGRDYRALRVCTNYLAFGTPAQCPQAGIATDTPMTCYKYVVWCTGTVELYDLMLDPAEVVNRWVGLQLEVSPCHSRTCTSHADSLPACRAASAPATFVSRLDAYMTVQGLCKGKVCYNPYTVRAPSLPSPAPAQTLAAAVLSPCQLLPCRCCTQMGASSASASPWLLNTTPSTWRCPASSTCAVRCSTSPAMRSAGCTPTARGSWCCPQSPRSRLALCSRRHQRPKSCMQ